MSGAIDARDVENGVRSTARALPENEIDGVRGALAWESRLSSAFVVVERKRTRILRLEQFERSVVALHSMHATVRHVIGCNEVRHYYPPPSD